MPFDLARYHALRRSSQVGVEVAYLEATTSTMDAARAGAAEGRPCGTAYIAGEQSAGRGRQGRSWISAASAGLYVTYHLCPDRTEGAPLLGLAAAVASAEAVQAACGLSVDLKWPNDLQVGGKKLAGILAEARPRGTGLDVFVGIGINLRTAAELPPEVAAIATSIEGAGHPAPPREVLLAALSTAFDARSAQAENDPTALLAEWRSRLVTIGQQVLLATPSGEVEGEAVDVTSTGELVLALPSGERRAFAAGDVTTVRR